MKLENIGFYTLSDNRAKNTSYKYPLQRCELILTYKCNFNCPYCRGIKLEDQKELSIEEAFYIIDLWSEHNLQNVRFSGGEPTLWKGLLELVEYSRSKKIKRIAVSTNGSANLEYYINLVNSGVNDFSISLDSCCASTGYKMSGCKNTWTKVVSNIKELSKISYVSVGVVLTATNYNEINETILFASNLGVSDIRIIPSAQNNKKLERLNIDYNLLYKHPILKYRFENFVKGRFVRGLTESDNYQCPLVLDDMAVLNGKHYPCIIYMREYGEAIDSIKGGIDDIRQKRKIWFEEHNCLNDPICRNNCLDVCVDYNNAVKNMNKNLYQ